MNMNNLTLKELNDLGIELSKESIDKIESMMNDRDSHWVIGKNYLIRTATMMNVGKLKKVTSSELVLTKATWVADSGRFGSMLEKGFTSSAELEIFQSDVIINRNAVIDATEYSHSLPESSQ